MKALRSSPLLPIFLIVFVDILGLTMLMPLLPFYAQSLGAGAVEVGLMMSVYAFCQLLAGPPLGNLSDRFGRKPVLLVSQAGTLAGFLILANATSLWMVFLARIIDGITAGNISVAQAYMSDVTRPSQRTRSFGLLGIAFGVGFLIGPATTGSIARAFGEHAAIYCAAGLSALSIAATTLLLPRHPPRPEPEPGEPERADGPTRRPGILDPGAYATYFRRPELQPLLAQFLTFTLSFAVFMGGFALFAQQRFSWRGHSFGTEEVSYCFTYAGLLGAFVQGGLLPRLVHRFGEWRVLGVALAASTISNIVLGFSGSVSMLATSFTIGALGGLCRPVLSGLISRTVGSHEQGTVIGITQSLNSISLIVGPVLAGFLIERQWLTGWALLAGSISAMGFAFYLLRPHQPAPAAAA